MWSWRDHMHIGILFKHVELVEVLKVFLTIPWIWDSKNINPTECVCVCVLIFLWVFRTSKPRCSPTISARSCKIILHVHIFYLGCAQTITKVFLIGLELPSRKNAWTKRVGVLCFLLAFRCGSLLCSPSSSWLLGNCLRLRLRVASQLQDPVQALKVFTVVAIIIFIGSQTQGDMLFFRFFLFVIFCISFLFRGFCCVLCFLVLSLRFLLVGFLLFLWRVLRRLGLRVCVSSWQHMLQSRNHRWSRFALRSQSKVLCFFFLFSIVLAYCSQYLNNVQFLIDFP